MSEKEMNNELENEKIDETNNTAEPAQEQAATEETTELTGEELLQKQLDEANEKVASLEDKYLRQVAEFDNYRKRTI